MKTDSTSPAEGGGVMERLYGRLAGPAAGRSARRHLRECGRGLAAFGCGLLLASLHGAAGLWVQRQPLWFCVRATQALAAALGFGMGLSAAVRAGVAVALPSLLSGFGRKFVIFLYLSLLWSGPVANTAANIERTAASLLCGAELAANQTQELMEKAAAPLAASMDKIREIGRNALSAAGRIKDLIEALTDGARHVARTLRNVLHFLADIGEVCNQQLGTPYRKCRAVFAEARRDCAGLLGEFDFLCNTLDGFQRLCELARGGELFCAVPAYVGRRLRERLEAPVVAAFAQIKREFEFNFSASVAFDAGVNGSRSLQEVAQDVMGEVSAQVGVFGRLGAPLAYVGLALLLLSFARAVQYRRSYLRDLDFDNVYITAEFRELDRRAAAAAGGGGASVLPLTPREARSYLTPLSLRLNAAERRLALRDVLAVLRHAAMGGVLVALDFAVFWMLDGVRRLVKEDVVARAPVTVSVAVNGTGYASDIFRDLAASFNVLQGGNVTVISRKCLPAPSEPDRGAGFLLGFLLGVALLLSLAKAPVRRCRRLVCARYHPERERARIQHLRLRILDQRATLGGALRRAAARIRADRSEGGGATDDLRKLLMRLPGGARLGRLLAAASCLCCGEALREGGDPAACGAPRCPGVFCRPCFRSLGNACALCVRPLTSEPDDAEEEERDSSEDEGAETTAATPPTGEGEESREASASEDDDWSSDDSSHSLENVSVHETRRFQDP